MKTRLVLDIDNTCLLTHESPDLSIPRDIIYQISIEGDAHYVYIRPGFSFFISVMREIFDEIYLFSAGYPEYVDSIANILRIDNSYSRDHCLFDEEGHTVAKKLFENGLDSVYTYYIDDLRLDTGCKYVIEGNNMTVVPPYTEDSHDETTELMTGLTVDISKWMVSKRLDMIY